MADFHETRMGQEFFLKNFPKLIKEVGRIADALEGTIMLPAAQSNTIYCQKIDEIAFAEILSEVSKDDVTVGYISRSIPNFRSKSMNRELTFQEAVFHLKNVVKKFIGKEVKNVENVNAREGFVYIAFTTDN